MPMPTKLSAYPPAILDTWNKALEAGEYILDFRTPQHAIQARQALNSVRKILREEADIELRSMGQRFGTMEIVIPHLRRDRVIIRPRNTEIIDVFQKALAGHDKRPEVEKRADELFAIIEAQQQMTLAELFQHEDTPGMQPHEFEAALKLLQEQGSIVMDNATISLKDHGRFVE